MAIARALVNDPALILADEPVGNLDDENARRVLELLCDACRQRGKTLLLVTHDRELVRSIDRILEIRSGWLAKIADEPTLLTSDVR